MYSTLPATATEAVTAATVAPYDHHDDDWDGPPGPVFVIFPIFWLLVFGTLAYVAWRYVSRSGTRAGEAALAQRFAAGEIDADEYAARRAVLRDRK
ncbi:SHOCT domain-containing protein [Nocardioides speluncae]|uniref:SHOCT domain-containing protein n=1 Tax=Nocardioides speluncae TaxID=2670337 RepID=UPI000D6984BA|nr:SHOCT domain-containing protein [Nocardioides speluncae]